MIQSKEELFAAVPRKRGTIAIGNGQELELYEMTMRTRFEVQEFAKANPIIDAEELYALMLTRCCPVLHGVDPTEIRERMQPFVIVQAGMKIYQLSGLLPDKETAGNSKPARKAKPAKKDSATTPTVDSSTA